MISPFAFAPPEAAIVAIVVVVLFFTDKLGDVARSFGESASSFKKGKFEGEKELEEAINETSGDVSDESESDGDHQGEEESESDSKSESDIDRPEEVDASVDKVEGIGETYSDRLEDADINTLYDLSNESPSRISDVADVSNQVASEWIGEAQALITSK